MEPIEEGIKLGKYRHQKVNDYRVIGVGRHSETLEKLVIYQALYDDEKFGNEAIWVRPIALFLAIKNVKGKEVPACEFIGK